MQFIQNRRDFLASAVTGRAAGVLGARGSLADEGPPETTTIRLAYYPTSAWRRCCGRGPAARGRVHRHSLCAGAGVLHDPQMVARGDIDFANTSPEPSSLTWTTARPSRRCPGFIPAATSCSRTSRSGPSATCGASVSHPEPELGRALYLAIMAAHVGLDPKSDFDWVISPDGNPMELFAEGKADAFLAFPPEPQELRARNIGRVILSTATDKPWSQYFCCMLFGNRDFVRDHPIATKRYLRAVLKAADYCADEPEKAAQRLVDAGFRGTSMRSRRSPRSSTGSGGTTTPRTPCASTRSSYTRRA